MRPASGSSPSHQGVWWVGDNSCADPQTICPRADSPPGVGYEMCEEICQQDGHAEMEAILKSGDEGYGGTMYLFGIDHVCPECQFLADANEIKIVLASGSASDGQNG
jgi:hypothetical protein